MDGVSYALDRLGWLQFQQLCAHVLELDAGVAPEAWEGDADQCRFTVADAGLGPPLLRTPVRDRVLVQCAWLWPGAVSAVVMAIETLMSERSEELRGLRSYVLMANGEAVADRPQPVVDGLTVNVIDTPVPSGWPRRSFPPVPMPARCGRWTRIGSPSSPGLRRWARPPSPAWLPWRR